MRRDSRIYGVDPSENTNEEPYTKGSEYLLAEADDDERISCVYERLSSPLTPPALSIHLRWFYEHCPMGDNALGDLNEDYFKNIAKGMPPSKAGAVYLTDASRSVFPMTLLWLFRFRRKKRISKP